MRHSFLETDWYTANIGETLLLQRPAVVKRGKRLEYLTIASNAGTRIGQFHNKNTQFRVLPPMFASEIICPPRAVLEIK